MIPRNARPVTTGRLIRAVVYLLWRGQRLEDRGWDGLLTHRAWAALEDRLWEVVDAGAPPTQAQAEG